LRSVYIVGADTAIPKKLAAIPSFSGNLNFMAQNPDVRWKQRFNSFRKAFRRLADGAVLAHKRDLSELEQQGLIQAFEFTHELAWKTLKDFLESKGAQDLFGPKPATREAFAAGLIEDGDVWMAMIKSRNQTSHTYNEDVAKEITQLILANYVAAFEHFQNKFGELEKRG
jgi:nucleotidyltransferase substrate binding protein (TIGR01987 family)